MALEEHTSVVRRRSRLKIEHSGEDPLRDPGNLSFFRLVIGHDGHMRGSGLLGGFYSPVGWVVGFIHAPLASVLDEDLTWRQALDQRLEVSPAVAFPDCVSLLEPLEAPWTSELLVDCGEWTAYLNNDKDGGDPTAAAAHLGNRIGVRCAIAVSSPMYGPGHGGTQLWITGPGGDPPGMHERSISAVAEDGRWSWLEMGDPLPFEDTQRYRARTVRHRLDRDLMLSYLSELGIRADDPEWFGPGVLVRQLVSWNTNPESRHDAARRLGVAAE